MNKSTSVTKIPNSELSILNKDILLKKLSLNGVILFEKGAKDVLEFAKFVRNNSSKLSMDPARTIESGAAQLVDAGTDAVGLHCENGNSPFWPDLCWFYCQEAPPIGSQTTICDGVAVYEQLSSKAKTFFLEKDICYSRNVPEEKWKKLVCHYIPELNDINSATFEHLNEIVSETENIKLTLNEDNSIFYQFTVSALQSSLVNNKLAFANSILGPSFNYEKPRITIAGTEQPIPSEILDEISKITELNTIPIDWDDNDFVLIDNRRVMHGRYKIIDERRKIFNALSYV
ncbi:TfdA family taurine catabolism dioxygenase TauD [Xenorhabdus cabanillasii]|uniref:TfdA family taurine catabolism dioxygenase TauD n=1 Tax=Xenorhabdus cabanillasii TaxID=351673 RepID=A0A3D9UKY6_9GAMM|nr:TauD/TfdA family dioxygenase [Xenorhabdus cabanillasii]REF28600.1 TfdA family taurine catabolism dioxygenase TauD [Xenorhabdus cabanillasii]